MITGIGCYDHTLSKIAERHSGHGIGIESHRLTVVTTLAYALHDWDLSQQRYIQLLGQTARRLQPSLPNR